ncbi:nitrous oxide reductase family maturation protein NosD [Chloroflexota bacterium]
MKKLTVLAALMLLLAMVVPSTVSANPDITISDSGWSDTTVGTWDPGTKTATLTKDLNEGIKIQGNGITLDGAGHTITGSGGGNGVDIQYGTLQGITIKNLNVTGFNFGIYVRGMYPLSLGNHVVENNILTGNDCGIRVIYATNNTLNGNTATNNPYYGIYVVRSEGNNLSGNVANENGAGIISDYCSGNIFNGNTANSNDKIGINLGGSTSSTLAGNTANGNGERGIHVGASGNILSGNTASLNTRDGIYLGPASNNALDGNTASFNGWGGITLWGGSSNNIISNNIATNNGYGGIRVCYGCDDNTLTGNTVNFNSWAGIRLMGVNNGNTIYHNNIMDNGSDDAPANNDWHEPTLLEGNYWSNYTGVDDGSGTGKHAIAGDGIGDTLIPHPVTDFDNYPFTNESGWEAPPVVSATLDIDPDTLNLKSKGVFTAYITLPDGYSVADIDLDTVACEGAPAIRGSIEGDTFIAKFNRQDLAGVEPGDEVEMTVTGEVTGTLFEGSDTIRVISKGK